MNTPTTAPSQTPLPSYAFDLLAAARNITHPPINATPDHMKRYAVELENAVIQFEAKMPMKNGETLEIPD